MIFLALNHKQEPWVFSQFHWLSQTGMIKVLLFWNRTTLLWWYFSVPSLILVSFLLKKKTLTLAITYGLLPPTLISLPLKLLSVIFSFLLAIPIALFSLLFFFNERFWNIKQLCYYHDFASLEASSPFLKELLLTIHSLISRYSFLHVQLPLTCWWFPKL